MIYAYNPGGEWTSSHQMSVNGKRDYITRDDVLAVGGEMSVKQAASIVDEVTGAVTGWPVYAADAGVGAAKIESISHAHRPLQ